MIISYQSGIFLKIYFLHSQIDGATLACLVAWLASRTGSNSAILASPPGLGEWEKLPFVPGQAPRGVHVASDGHRPSPPSSPAPHITQWVPPREAKRQGETIAKGHKHYELMLNLQLGIRCVEFVCLQCLKLSGWAVVGFEHAILTSHNGRIQIESCWCLCWLISSSLGKSTSESTQVLDSGSEVNF